jgi:hypothetical protein
MRMNASTLPFVGRVGAGADVADAVLGEHVAEGVGAVPAAVIGQDAGVRAAYL